MTIELELINKQVNDSLSIDCPEEQDENNEEKKKAEIYYFSASNYNKETMRFIDFIETECFERGNYNKNDIIYISQKYNLLLSRKVRWVVLNAEALVPYCDFEYRKDKNGTEYKWAPIDFVSNEDGFIIPETDDGNGGFLFVYYDGITK